MGTPSHAKVQLPSNAMAHDPTDLYLHVFMMVENKGDRADRMGA
jgi:hypothetical protein